MQAFSWEVVNHLGGKESLVVVEMVSQHVDGEVKLVLVWEILFGLQETSVEGVIEASYGEMILFASSVHPFQHRHLHYQFWEHLSSNQ